jgi:hypothetical protein
MEIKTLDLNGNKTRTNIEGSDAAHIFFSQTFDSTYVRGIRKEFNPYFFYRRRIAKVCD